VGVLIWGDLSQCVGGLAGATWFVSAMLMGQKSAEVVIPVGIAIVGKG
jgi:hypothetical protein